MSVLMDDFVKLNLVVDPAEYFLSTARDKPVLLLHLLHVVLYELILEGVEEAVLCAVLDTLLFGPQLVYVLVIDHFHETSVARGWQV